MNPWHCSKIFPQTSWRHWVAYVSSNMWNNYFSLWHTVDLQLLHMDVNRSRLSYIELWKSVCKTSQSFTGMRPEVHILGGKKQEVIDKLSLFQCPHFLLVQSTLQKMECWKRPALTFFLSFKKEQMVEWLPSDWWPASWAGLWWAWLTLQHSFCWSTTSTWPTLSGQSLCTPAWPDCWAPCWILSWEPTCSTQVGASGGAVGHSGNTDSTCQSTNVASSFQDLTPTSGRWWVTSPPPPSASAGSPSWTTTLWTCSPRSSSPSSCLGWRGGCGHDRLTTGTEDCWKMWSQTARRDDWPGYRWSLWINKSPVDLKMVKTLYKGK